MKKKHSKSFELNSIKIHPIGSPNYLEIFTNKFLEPNILKTIRNMKKNNVVSLPKLSKIKTKLYSNDISSSQLINESSIL